MSSVAATASFFHSWISNSRLRRQGSFLKVCFAIAAIFGLLAVAQPAVAATFTWDPGLTQGPNGGGAGTWGTASNWWNASVDTNWSSTANVAFFGGTSGAVTLSGSQGANGLIFGSTGYSLTSGTISLLGPTPSISYSGAGNGAVISSVVLDSAGITAQLGPTSSLTFSGSLAGAGALTQTGGTLNLSGSNSGYTGAVSISTSGASPGALVLSNAAGLSGATSISLSNNSSFSTVTGVPGTAAGRGTYLDLRSLTTGGTLPANISMATDVSLANYNTAILAAPAAGSTLTLSGSLTNNNFGLGIGQIYNSGAGTVAVNGPLVGSGSFSYFGGGYLALGGTNAVFGGNLTVSTSGSAIATLKVTNATAQEFNSSMTLDLVNTGSLSTATGGTGTDLDLQSLIANTTLPAMPIYMMTDASNSNLRAAISFAPSAGNTVTLTSPIYLSGAGPAQIYTNGAGTVAINGNITGSAANLTMRGSNNVILMNGIANLSSATVMTVTDNAILFLNNPGNWGATTISFGTIKLNGANVLPLGTTVTLGQSGASASTLDLQSSNQTIAGVTFSNVDTSNQFITASTGPANLTLTSTSAGLTLGTSGSLTLGGSVNVVTPVVNFVATSNAMNLTSSGAATLNLGGGTINALAVSNGSTNTVSATIVGNGGITIAANGNLTDTGGIGGGSAGYLALTGANTYNGGTTITAGLVNPGATDAPFGPVTNPINLSGGGLLATANASYSAARSVVLLSGTGYLRQYTGDTMTINGPISGSGQLNKIDNGTLVLTGANNTYSGLTYVGSGALVVSNTAGSATGSGNVQINAGTLSSGAGNVGFISGGVIPGTGSMAVTPGGGGTIGTLTLGSLTTNANSTLYFDLTTPGGSGDQINVTGSALNFSSGGTIAVGNPLVNPSTPAPGNYRIFQVNPTATTVSGTANVSFGLPRQNQQYSLVSDPFSTHYLDLNVTALTPITGNWLYAGAATTSWANAANWNGGPIPAVQGDVALLNDTPAATPVTITLDSQPHVGTLTLNPQGAGSYTIAAGNNGVLVIDNTGSTAGINNGANLNTISAPVTLVTPTTNVSVSGGTLLVSGAVGGSGGLVVQSGSGPLILSGNGTYTGGTSILSGGTLQIGNGGNLNTITGGVADNGTLSFSDNNNATFANSISGSGNLVLSSSYNTNPPNVTLTGTNTYSGGTVINEGRIQVASGAALGSGPVTITSGLVGSGGSLGTGNGELFITGGTIANTINIAGPGTTEGAGNLGALRMSGGVVTGAVNLTAAATIGSGGGAGAITGVVTGDAFSPLTIAYGTTTLTNTNNSIAGGINFVFTNNAWGTLISANPGALGSGGGAPGNVNLPAGPTLGLYADGDGSGVPNIAGTYSDALTFSGSTASLSVGRTGQGLPYGTLLFANGANKQVVYSPGISLGAVTTPQTLIVTNNNGYGLNLAGAVSLSNSSVFSVANATASNVTQGLTISGLVSGAGFTKAGSGTLVLSNSNNNFSGNIVINQGVVSIDANGVLETNNNAIFLSPSAGTATLRATGTLNLGNGNLTLNTASNTSAIEVVSGQTLTVGNLVLNAPSASLVKADNGTLILGGVNTGWTGSVAVDAGAVQFASASALPSTAGTIGVGNVSGAALQLLGNLTISNSVNLNLTATNFTPGGINGGGDVESVSGVNTLAGPIFLNQDAGVGADAGATLNITGGIPTIGHRVVLAGAGNINISGGSLGNIYAIDQIGSGTTTLSVSMGSLTNSGLNVANGAFVISGTAKIAAFATSDLVTVQSGGTLTLNDSLTTPVLNRMGSNALTLDGGTFNYIANGTSASTENLGNFTYSAGGSTIILNNPGAAALTVTMSNIASTGGSSLNIVTPGGTLGTSTDKLLITGATNVSALSPSASNTGIYSRVTVNGTSFATFGGTASGVIPFTAYNASNNLDTSQGTDTLNITAAPAWTRNYIQVNNAIAIGSGVTINGPVAGATLAPTTANFLVGSGSATIGSNTTVALAGVENGFLINAGATLNLQGPVTGTYNINKALGGALIFSAPVYDTTTTNWLGVNGGTVQLNAGNATLLSGISVNIDPGATFDLNGNAQVISSLLGNFAYSAALGAPSGSIPGGGGTLTSSSGTGTLVVTEANASDIFSGQITGSVMLAKAGGNTATLNNVNNYSGPTMIYGGSLTLQDSGSLTGTPSIGVNYGTLALNDGSNYLPLNNRVGTAPITLSGGIFTYAGRPQTASVENVGPVALAQGQSFITSTAGGTGVNSADLILTSLTQQSTDATVNFSSVAGSTGASGLLGSNGRVQITNAPALANNIIGPWAIVERDFASYEPGLGVGPLNATGFAGYSNTSLNPSTWQSTDNVKVTSTTTPLTANTTINTLNVNYSANATVDLGGQTLTLGAGSLGGGLMFDTGTSTTVATLQDGFVTAGSTNSPADLYFYFEPYAGTARTGTVTAAITNNLAGGPVRLIYNASDFTTNLLTLQGTNTYTGGTVVNAGMLVLGASGSLPAGGITINGSPANGGNTGLTQTAGGVIAAQPVTLNGAASLTLGGSQALTSVTINNSGGTTAPTISGGTLSVPANGGITVTSNNVSTVATISSVLDFANAAPTFSVSPVTVNSQAVSPWLASLNISGVIQHAGNLTWAGGGNVQLSAQSTFTGGVTPPTSGGDLIIGASSTPSAALNGAGLTVVTGPLGTGTLTLNSGAVLLSSASANAVANPVAINGNFTFGGVTSVSLNGVTTLPASSNTLITVTAPQMVATLGGGISGNSASIEKSGLGALVLGNYNTFTGGVTVDSGSLSLTGPNGADPQPAGTGLITVNGGQLLLHNNGQLNNGLIYENNNVLVANSTAAFIDVNNNGANTGGSFVMGSLNYATSASGAVLNISGGNGYNVLFNSTNLTSLATPVTVNVASGLSLTMPGGFTTGTNVPVNVGAGYLIFAGTNSGVSSTYAVTAGSTMRLSPIANTANYYSPTGTTGAIALGAGSTLQVLPQVGATSIMSTAGYTPGGLLGRYYDYNGATIAITAAGASGIVPAAVLPGQNPSDASLQIRPVVVANTGSFTDSMAYYSGLLKINSPGTYYFQEGADDAMTFSIDGAMVFQQNGSTTTGQAQAIGTPEAIYLTSGLHQITLKTSNQGGNGAEFLMYGGPDTAGNGLVNSAGATPALQNIPASDLFYANSPAAAGNNFQNAAQVSNALSLPANTSATIDAIGSDLNTTFASLTMGGSSTAANVLSVSNTGGLGTVGILGATTISAAGANVSPGAGTLYLIGGVSDSNGSGGGYGLTKTGSGTLILGPSQGTFFGPLSVTAGYLQVASSAALTSGTTTIANGGAIDLNGVSNLSGYLVVSGSGPVSGTYATLTRAALFNSNVNAASTATNATLAIGAASTQVGGYGNINLQGTVIDNGNTWFKVGPDMLTLSGNNVTAGASSVTGSLTVNNGILQTASANALGNNNTSALGIAIASGATMDLDGMTLAGGRNITLNGLGVANNGGVSISGGYSSYNSLLGALINSVNGTTAVYSGSITLTGATGIGSMSYASSSVGGDITLNGTIGPAVGGVGINKVGLDTLTITNSVVSTTGGYNLFGGTTILTGTGGAMTGGGPINLTAGASLILNNAVNNVNNRFGGGANGETFDSNVLIIGNSIGTTENAVTFKFTNSSAVITLQPDPNGTLSLGTSSNTAAFTQSGAATALFRGPGLGSESQFGLTNGMSLFILGTQTNPGFSGNQNGGVNATNRGVLAWALVDTSTTGYGVSLATYDNQFGFQPLNFSTNGATNVLGLAALNANVLLTTSVSTTANSGFSYINSLTLQGGSVAIAAGTTLPIISGGLLNLSGAVGSPNVIAGPGALSVYNNTNLYVHSPSTFALAINAPIMNTTGGLTKADGGLVSLGTSELYTGQTTVNGGTLQLASGVQTIFQPFEIPPTPGNMALSTIQNTTMQVNNGGFLDLDGNNQTSQIFNSANPIDLTGGSVGNSGGNTASFRIAPNANETWSGVIAGNVNFVRDGYSTTTFNSPQTYTGTTTLLGGVLQLLDYASLQTSSIDIRRSSLLWDNSAIQPMSNRLTNSNGLIPITFDGGAFRFNGRGGMNDVANIGAIAFNSGSARIDIQANNGSATLNIASITRNVGADATFTAGAGPGANNGSLGNNPYIIVGTPPALTNGMIGGWAVTLGVDLGQGGTTTEPAFATYDPTMGIIGLESYNQVNGGANGQGNLFTASGNVHLIASAALPGTPGLTSTTTVNSLTMTTGAATLSFVNPTDTLVLQSGGLLGGSDNNARIVGAVPGQGILTTAAGEQELFIHNANTTASNPLTINSNITDNGSPVAVVIDTLGLQGAAITLAGSNTFTGTTYVNGGIVNLSSTAGMAISGTSVIIANNNNNGNDSGVVNDTTITLQASNQINPAASVQVLGGGEFVLNSFNQTIKNLTINNDGSTNGANGPAVLTGTGMLTVSGSVSATSPGNGNTTGAYDIPTINGELTLTSISPTIYVDPTAVPNQIALQLNAAVSLTGAASLTKTGSGVLGIGGQSLYSGATKVLQGGVAFGASGAFIGNSQVSLAAGTFLDTRGFSGTIGSLTGSGTLTNDTTAGAGTVVTGWDNTNTTFSGAITNPFNQDLLSLTKIGSGTMTLTTDNRGIGLNSPNLSALTVAGGGLTLSGSGGVGFITNTFVAGSTVTLNNTVNAMNDRLGSSFEYPSPTVIAPSSSARTAFFEGGNLTILGNANTPVTEDLGNISFGNNTVAGGGSVITLAATNTQGINLTVNGISFANGYGTVLIRGDNLGSSSGTTSTPNTAIVTSLNQSTPLFTGIVTQGTASINGQPTMPILQEIVMDPSSTGSGLAFATSDSVTGQLRPLGYGFTNAVSNSGELAPSLAALALSSAPNITNVGFTTPQLMLGSTSVNSLTLSGGGSITSPGGAVGALLSGGAATLTVNTGGILATSGTDTIGVGAVTSAGVSMDIHVAGASTVLYLNSVVLNTTSGFVKGDGGTLIVNAPQFYSGVQGLEVNGGSMQLNGGNYTLPALVATVPTVYMLGMNSGTLDLNGYSEAVGTLSSANPLPGMGGNITNSAAAAVNLISVGSPGSYGGTISDNASGPLSFYKAGGNTQVFTAPQTYQGATTVQGGGLTLTSLGALTATSVVNVNYSTLTLDNTGLADIASRLGTAALNMNGTQFVVNARMGNDSVNLGAVNVTQGGENVAANLYNANQQTGGLSLTLASLNQSNFAAINFAANTGTLGAAGDNAHVMITANPTLTNGIIGGWATVGGTDFATYNAALGIQATTYSSDALTAGVPSDNINAAAAVGVTTRTINSLRINATAAQVETMNDYNQVLTVATGGLLVSNTAGTTINGGQLTAGSTANAAAALYQYTNSASTLTINSQIVNNGTGPVTLVHSGAGALVLTPEITAPTGGSLASGVTTITMNSVNGNSGVFVGEGVSAITGGSIAAGTTVTAINGNVLTLSTATTAALPANSVLAFAPPAVNAGENNSTTLNVNNSTFTPTVGMAVGGTGIQPATSITAVSGSSGAWVVTLNQAATTNTAQTLTFGANSNTFTGATVDNGIGGSNSLIALSGLPGSIVIPGNLIIQGNGVVTETTVYGGQIAPSSNVTINGSGLLNLSGINTLASVTFNDIGGTGTPTLGASTALTLTSPAAITATNNNFAATPAINGSSVVFSSSNATVTINTSGLAPVSLNITAPISAVGTIIKSGTGTLELSNGTNTMQGMNLTQGGLMFGVSSISATTGTFTSPLGSGTLSTSNNTTILAGGGPQTIGNPVVVTGNLTFGGNSTANNLILTGPVKLNNNATLTVSSPVVTAAIDSVINVPVTGLTKAGSGTLELTTNNTYAGATNITGGILRLGLPASGMLYDLDATSSANIVNGGGDVTTFADLSGHNNNFVNANSSVTMVNGGPAFNNKSVLSFTATSNAGTNPQSTLAMGNSTAPETVFIVEQVLNLSGTNNLENIWGKTGTDEDIRSTQQTAAAPFINYPGNTNDYTFGGGSMSVNGVVAGTNPSAGTAQLLTVSAGSNGVGVLPWTSTSLSNYTLSNRGLGGYIGEVVAYSASLSAADKTTIQDYLLSKWFGTAEPSVLPSTTPVTISNGATFDMTDFIQTVSSLSSTDGNGSKVLLGNGVLTVNGAATTTFDGVISGAGGSLYKQGAGMLSLTGTSNSFTGSLAVNGGSLAVASLGDGGAGSNGTGTINLSASTAGATLQFIGSNGAQTGRAINLLNNATIDASGSSLTAPLLLSGMGNVANPGIAITGSGALTLAGNGVAGGEISGIIGTGITSLTKNGSGTWTLDAGNNTNSNNVNFPAGNLFSGPTTINAGTLVVNNAGNNSLSATSTGDVTINGGVLASSSYGGTILGNVWATGAASNAVFPGNGAANGVLSIGGSLTFNSSSTLEFGISSGLTNSSLSISQALVANGTATVVIAPGSTFADNTYDLANFNAGTNATLSNFNLVGAPGSSLELLNGNTELALVAVPVTSGIWISPNSGNWSGASNWLEGNIPSGQGAVAIFSGSASPSSVTATLDSPRTVGTLVLGNSAGPSTSYTLSGSTLTLDNSTNSAPSQVMVVGGSHMLAAPVFLANGGVDVTVTTGGTINISGNIADDNGAESLTLAGDGSGELILSGNANSYGGGTIIENGGILVDAANGAIPNGSSLTVQAGGTFAFDSTQALFGSPVVGGSAIASSREVSAVPEPGTLALLFAGLCGAAVYCRSRRAKKAV